MTTIWKYPLNITDQQTISLPQGAKILSVQLQGLVSSQLHLWAEVDTEQIFEGRVIEIFGTGNPITPGRRRYIDTVQMHGGALVWHIYEQIPG